jgi:XXXCH domain-containing protein
MEREDKLKMTCTPEELSEILRSMADAMEQQRLSLDTLELGWNEVERISLTVSNAAGMAEVKLKVSSGARSVVVPDTPEDHPEETPAPFHEQDPEQAGKPREGYGSLKKRMKKSFKNIMYALHENTWPAMIDIDDFIKDSEQMVLYPGKGDEFYSAYAEAVTGFRVAVQAQDMEAAFQAAHLLNTIKTQCHKKYD